MPRSASPATPPKAEATPRACDMEFTTEELLDAIDRVVRELLDLHDVTGPPIDALAIVTDEFEYATREAEPEISSTEPICAICCAASGESAGGSEGSYDWPN